MNLLEQATAEGVHGFIHPVELEKLAELATGRDVLEVGAFMGLSAWGMAHTARSVQSLDTFSAATDGQRQTGELTTLDAYRKAVARFPNVLPPVVATSKDGVALIRGSFDMIFLDAMHTYEDVIADINRWYPRVRSRGIMAFHDYKHDHFPGVTKAVLEQFGELFNHHVTLGWIEKL